MRQLHHIEYIENAPNGGWIVELSGLQHQCITALQRCKATPENYANIINFLHAVMAEVNRIRKTLDLGEEG